MVTKTGTLAAEVLTATCTITDSGWGGGDLWRGWEVVGERIYRHDCKGSERECGCLEESYPTRLCLGKGRICTAGGKLDDPNLRST